MPANNFGEQKPGSNEEIQTFCKRTYEVPFPLLAKVNVRGDDIAPLYSYLVDKTGREIEWNFTTIFVSRDGTVLQRFEPNVDPQAAELQEAIERALRD